MRSNAMPTMTPRQARAGVVLNLTLAKQPLNPAISCIDSRRQTGARCAKRHECLCARAYVHVSFTLFVCWLLLLLFLCMPQSSSDERSHRLSRACKVTAML
jgi:hypothetical protein